MLKRLIKILGLLLISTLSFAGNDALVVVEQAAGKVSFYDPSGHQRLGETDVGFLPHEIALSADGNTAYVSNFGLQDYDEHIGIPGDTISVIDTHSFKEITRLSTGFQNAPHGVKIRPNHAHELYVNTEKDNKILVFDLQKLAIKKEFPAIPETHNFIFSPDGTTLWLLAGSNGVIKVDADTGTVLGEYHTGTPVRGLQYTPDGRSIMVSSTNQISFFNPDTLTTTRTLDNLGVDQILYSAISPDGRFIIAPAVWNNQILVIDYHKGTVVKRLVTGLDPVNVVIDDQSHYAYISNARNAHVSRVDLYNLQVADINTQAGPNGLALIHHTENLPPPAPAKPQLVMGAFLPLTGEHKDLGRQIMLGYEFWRDLLNQQGGLKIGAQFYEVKIAYKDTQSMTDNLPTLLDELKAEYHLNGLMNAADKNQAEILHSAQLPIYPFMADLEGYESLDKTLFAPYATEQELFHMYQNSLNLSMSKLAERAYLSVRLLQRTLSDQLYLPDHVSHAPALVLLHASSGIQDTDRDWAKRLQQQGYAVLLVDSFTARGYIDRKAIGWDKAYQAQIEDVHDAYLTLTQQKTINPERIGLIGFSLGGYSTLLAMQEKVNVPFKRAASFYGHAQRVNPGTPFKGPIALFYGDDDDRAPLSGAVALKNGAPDAISLYHYPNAKHGFDNSYLPESLELVDENGMVYHLGYKKTAHEQSFHDLLQFLQDL